MLVSGNGGEERGGEGDKESIHGLARVGMGSCVSGLRKYKRL